MGGDPEDLVQLARLYGGFDEEAILINMLADEIERLREALRKIAKSQLSDSEQAYIFKMLARAALEGKQ